PSTAKPAQKPVVAEKNPEPKLEPLATATRESVAHGDKFRFASLEISPVSGGKVRYTAAIDQGEERLFGEVESSDAEVSRLASVATAVIAAVSGRTENKSVQLD